MSDGSDYSFSSMKVENNMNKKKSVIVQKEYVDAPEAQFFKGYMHALKR